MICCCSDKLCQLLCLYVCICGQILSQATNACSVHSISIYRSKYGKKVELSKRRHHAILIHIIGDNQVHKPYAQVCKLKLRLINSILVRITPVIEIWIVWDSPEWFSGPNILKISKYFLIKLAQI